MIDVIHESTQPSPSDTKTLHDFEPGLHARSRVDGSLECQQPQRCSTHSLHFLLGSIGQLHDTVCEALADAVRSFPTNVFEMTLHHLIQERG